MKLYVQLMIIFSISIIGEGISSVFHLPIPGSIIGLILLFLALQFKLLRLRHVVMDKFHVIAPYLLPIVLIILGAIVLNVIVIALVVQFIKQHFEGDYEEGGMDHV